jgi:hypothetical protein
MHFLGDLNADERRSVFREREVMADRIVLVHAACFTNTIMLTAYC